MLTGKIVFSKYKIIEETTTSRRRSTQFLSLCNILPHQR
ncbi:MAG: hypothetical protein QG657_4944 [Acidobacteriota bacterium]|nr:hypothetical protein [Acidobacteriota bacterium]